MNSEDRQLAGRGARARLSTPLLALMAAVAVPSVAQVPLGPLFQVNTYTTGFQGLSATVFGTEGDFTIIWQSDSFFTDPVVREVRGRRFASDGAPLGDDLVINQYPVGLVGGISVGTGLDGQLVVAWGHFDGSPLAFEVKARRFSSSGVALGPQFAVNRYTTGSQLAPRIAVLPTSDFVIAWEGNEIIDDETHPIAQVRRYASNGTPLSGDLRLDADGARRPVVAVGAPGELLVAWEFDVPGNDGDQNIQVRRFTSTGVPLGAAFLANTYTTGRQRRPAIASSSAGDFVVVWENVSSAEGGTTSSRIRARRFSGDGAALSAEFEVDEQGVDNEYPTPGMNGAGDFIVAWHSQYFTPGEDDSARARRFASDGTPLTSEFRVETYTTSAQRHPRVTLGASQFVITWSSSWSDGTDPIWSVQAQRFGFTDDLIFADGFESGDLAAWSTSVGASDLAVSGAAAMVGAFGLAVDLTNPGPAPATRYVQDDTPERLWRHRARFYLDPNGYLPGVDGQRLKLLQLLSAPPDLERLATVVLRRQGGVYRVLAKVHLDDGSWADTGFHTISDDPHAVEIDWRRAIAAGADDGSLELFIDGVSVAAIGGLDNDDGKADSVRLGALGVKPGAAGSLYLDAFESRRAAFIGLEP